ncbi:MAG: hypothetical protein KGL46_00200 [Hyphomicrobiales bacterium]|nr:hypothetical protein [Hyphomicrobiales bacterium]
MAKFTSDTRGSIAVITGGAIAVLALIAGVAVDYAALNRRKAELQTLADDAALAAARASRLSNATLASVGQIASNIVAAHDGRLSAPVTRFGSSTAPSPANNGVVTVTINDTFVPGFAKITGKPVIPLGVSATAQVKGAAPLCLAALATKGPQYVTPSYAVTDAAGLAALKTMQAKLPNTIASLISYIISLLTSGAPAPTANPDIHLSNGAKITALNCTVQANLQKPNSYVVQDTAVVSAPSILSSGGYVGSVGANYSQAPQTDVPTISDPLAGMTMPPVGSCTATAKVISGGTTTLAPGTYCGGLSIQNGASVKLSTGVYVFLDGPLLVSGGSTLDGSAGVTFYFTATSSKISAMTPASTPNLYFSSDSTISLSAPLSGQTAGFMLMGNPSLPPGLAYTIASNNAHTLEGTVYLPVGNLSIVSTSKIADTSNYTILVVNSLTIAGNLDLTLNANYKSSVIPAPPGVGPNYVGGLALVR